MWTVSIKSVVFDYSNVVYSLLLIVTNAHSNSKRMWGGFVWRLSAKKNSGRSRVKTPLSSQRPSSAQSRHVINTPPKRFLSQAPTVIAGYYCVCFRVLTNLFLVLYQIGSSCVYAVFIASNLKAVSDDQGS